MNISNYRILYTLILTLIVWGPNNLFANTENSNLSSYRIRYGDKFELSVYGETGTNLKVSVGPDGKIQYLFSISISAVGRTISEVRKDITKGLSKYFKHPLLNIIPLGFSPEFYTIIGEVISPGIKVNTPNSTLLTALCEAGGFTTRLFRNQTVDQVDLKRSFLARKGKYMQIDFEDLLQRGNMEWNIPLQEGDYLYFANAGIHKVFVLGEVQHNTVVDYLNGITLLQALADAGGVTPRASSRVLVIRGSLAYPRWYYIDSNLIFKGKACDFELQPKDIIYVPPMRFSTLKDILEGGVSSFVSIVANIGGSNSFLEIDPAAKTANVISAVPVVGTATVPSVAPITPTAVSP